VRRNIACWLRATRSGFSAKPPVNQLCEVTPKSIGCGVTTPLQSPNGLAGRSIVSGRLTQHITEQCDRITQECEGLLDSVDHLDSEIDRLSTWANYLMVRIGLLRRAQADLEPQLTTLSWRVFWSNLRPTVILARLGQALRSHRHGTHSGKGPDVHSDGLIPATTVSAFANTRSTRAATGSHSPASGARTRGRFGRTVKRSRPIRSPS